MLRQRKSVPMGAFLQRLEISRATFKRDLEYLRDRHHAPIIWDAQAGGYRLKADSGLTELPGMWFSAHELYALLAAQKLLADIEPSLLNAELAPLQARLAELLAATGHAPDALTQRVRLISVAHRAIEPTCFAHVVTALVARRRLAATHWNRARDETNHRELSPQRLVHYRGNWYLDAWCHLRGALRSFALETLSAVTLSDEAAIDVPEPELAHHYASAYGIFAGPAIATASLIFSAERARWVRFECWHPEQQSEDLPDGRYRLRLPYSDERELVMDILRHGAHVVVEAPQSLRQSILQELQRMASAYTHPPPQSD